MRAPWVAQWVADRIPRGQEEEARSEAGACHGHHWWGRAWDASESSCSPGRAAGFGVVTHLPPCLRFSTQRSRPSLACLEITRHIRATATSRSLRPTASHRNGLTTDRQAAEPRGSAGLRCHYLSCFLGRVLLQNLGLAAGEGRGLEVQAGRKQEKEH